MTRACGNRTLVPYTAPLRAPLSTARTSWYFGSRMTRSIAVCVGVSGHVSFELRLKAGHVQIIDSRLRLMRGIHVQTPQSHYSLVTPPPRGMRSPVCSVVRTT